MAGILGVFGDWKECCALTEKQRDLLALIKKTSEEFNSEGAGGFEKCIEVLSENQNVKPEQALEAYKRCLSSYYQCLPYDRFYPPPFPYNRFNPLPFPYDRFSAPPVPYYGGSNNSYPFPYYGGSNNFYPFPYYGGSNNSYPFPYYGFPLGPCPRW